MHLRSMTLAAAAILLSTAAGGQPTADRRIIPMEDGFIEIDPQSGAVTHCQRTPEGYRCVPSKSDQSALLGDIERLKQENAEMRRQLAQREPSLRLQEQTKPQLPTDQEIDRALDIMERFLRRFMRSLRNEKPDRT